MKLPLPISAGHELCYETSQAARGPTRRGHKGGIAHQSLNDGQVVSLTLDQIGKLPQQVAAVLHCWRDSAMWIYSHAGLTYIGAFTGMNLLRQVGQTCNRLHKQLQVGLPWQPFSSMALQRPCGQPARKQKLLIMLPIAEAG